MIDRKYNVEITPSITCSCIAKHWFGIGRDLKLPVFKNFNSNRHVTRLFWTRIRVACCDHLLVRDRRRETRNIGRHLEVAPMFINMARLNGVSPETTGQTLLHKIAWRPEGGNRFEYQIAQRRKCRNPFTLSGGTDACAGEIIEDVSRDHRTGWQPPPCY